jgi:2-C-methyl-D-erythritol 4-phosphate cytidylyltransferase
MKKVSAIIVAAGEGRRFGSPKQFSLLKGKPVLAWTLDTFNSHQKINEIILVIDDLQRKTEFADNFPKITAVVNGGEKRQDSVFNGFCQIKPDEAEIVLIHDGVRPLVGNAVIDRVVRMALEKGAAIPVIPFQDTVKRVAKQEVLETLDRNTFFKVQTPQGFFFPLLSLAFEKARKENFYGTDEASLVEKMEEKVFVVEGSPTNIKITTPSDLKMAGALLGD